RSAARGRHGYNAERKKFTHLFDRTGLRKRLQGYFRCDISACTLRSIVAAFSSARRSLYFRESERSFFTVSRRSACTPLSRPTKRTPTPFGCVTPLSVRHTTRPLHSNLWSKSENLICTTWSTFRGSFVLMKQPLAEMSMMSPL